MTRVEGSWLSQLLEQAQEVLGAEAPKATGRPAAVSSGGDVAEEVMDFPPDDLSDLRGASVAADPALGDEARTQHVQAQVLGVQGAFARSRTRSISMQPEIIEATSEEARAAVAAERLKWMSPEERVRAIRLDYARDPEALAKWLGTLASTDPAGYKMAMEAMAQVVSHDGLGPRPEDNAFVNEVLRLEGPGAATVQSDLWRIIDARIPGTKFHAAAMDWRRLQAGLVERPGVMETLLTGHDNRHAVAAMLTDLYQVSPQETGDLAGRVVARLAGAAAEGYDGKGSVDEKPRQHAESAGILIGMMARIIEKGPGDVDRALVLAKAFLTALGTVLPNVGAKVAVGLVRVGLGEVEKELKEKAAEDRVALADAFVRAAYRRIENELLPRMGQEAYGNLDRAIFTSSGWWDLVR